MRQIPAPGFPEDDGSVTPDVAAALAGYQRDPENLYLDALMVLQDARVLVPVLAVAGEVVHDDAGLVHDKTADMAACLMTGKDGRTALLGFTGLGPLRTWQADARPVPVSLPQAALAACQQEAQALVLDVAGPAVFVLEGDQLLAVAEGLRLLRLPEGAWVWATSS